MIEIVDIRYCRLGTADLESRAAFAKPMIRLYPPPGHALSQSRSISVANPR